MPSPRPWREHELLEYIECPPMMNPSVRASQAAAGRKGGRGPHAVSWSTHVGYVSGTIEVGYQQASWIILVLTSCLAIEHLRYSVILNHGIGLLRSTPDRGSMARGASIATSNAH